MIDSDDRWLSVEEAKDVIGASASSVRGLIRDGKITAIQHAAGGKYRIRYSECARYLSSLTTTSPAA